MPVAGMMLPGQMRPGAQQHLNAALQGLLARPPAGINPLAMYPGMRMDPWKALVIKWDDDTPQNWPQRISPWEVRFPPLVILVPCTHSCIGDRSRGERKRHGSLRDSLDVLAQLAEDKGGVMRAEKKAELARNQQLRNEAAARHHAACASLQRPQIFP